jgi:hypothetical protein
MAQPFLCILEGLAVTPDFGHSCFTAMLTSRRFFAFSFRTLGARVGGR